MRVHRLSGDAIEVLLRRSTILSTILVSIAVAVGILITLFNTRPAPIWPFAIVIPGVLVAILLGVRRALQRQRLAWHSFELQVMPDGIRRSMAGYPDIEIRRDEISAFEDRDDGLLLRAAGRHVLLIPRGLVGFDEVRGDLTAWHSVQEQGRSAQGHAWPLLTVVGTLIMFATVLVATDARVVVPLAAILLTGAAWSIWAVRRSPHIDARTKRTIWLVVMPAAAVLLKALASLGV